MSDWTSYATVVLCAIGFWLNYRAGRRAEGETHNAPAAAAYFMCGGAFCAGFATLVKMLCSLVP